MQRLSLIIFLFLSISFSQSPHGNELALDCDLCHTTNSWKINPKESIFDHSKTGFELSGQHKLVDCSSCHQNLTFVENNSECIACHIDIHRGNNGIDCQLCHTPGSWESINKLEIHQSTRFPLVGAHIFADCIDCHVAVSFVDFEPLSVDCYSCHSQDYITTQVPDHSLNNISQECDECHMMTSFTWDLNYLEHSFFPLVGGHSSPTCYECHTNSTLENTDSECYNCHNGDYNSASNPNHISNQFSTDCSECHTTNPGWSPVTFDHDLVYNLTGAHNLIRNECSSCHTHGYYNTDSECYSCHKIDYDSVTDPNHIELNFSQDCEECHTTNPGWMPATVEHEVFYPLVGGHQIVENDCSLCHAQGYSNTSDYCFDCHIADYNNSSEPNHVQNQLSHDCEDCHTTNPGWTPTTFDHDEVYTLTGGHQVVENDCILCHANGYSNIGTDCLNCHITNYNSTTEPNHINEQFSTNCEDCHTTNPGWSPTVFDHNSVYALTGAHTLIQDECNKCHGNGYSNIGTDCSNCHLTDYNATTDPNHVSNQFSTNCEECHTTDSGWTPVNFDHNIVYPLTGGHNLVKDDCALCHSSGYTATSSDCSSCHMADFNSTSEPNHAVEQFPQDCSICHSTDSGWTPIIFDHNAVFALTGAHSNIENDCNQCHASGYTNVSSYCASCHLSDYNSATNPNHIANQFPQDCSICHSTNPGWSPSTFDHNSVYPLTGGHNLVKNNCALCHGSGYNNTSTNCFDCHSSDYNNASDPNHSINNFSTNCKNCHTTNPGWSPSTFDHNTVFALTGAHNLIKNDCIKCHSSGYSNTSSDCVSCHLSDYNNTTNPNHSSSNFPQNCKDCHTTSSWTPATFDHDGLYFPIYSGNHRNVWSSCSTCHTNASNYSVFTCINCHEHSNQAEVNNDHSDVSGYVYNSYSCYDCHPNGRE